MEGSMLREKTEYVLLRVGVALLLLLAAFCPG